MKHYLIVLTAAGLILAPQARAEDKTDVARRLTQSAQTLRDMAGGPETGIPEAYVERARCVVVVPNMKRGAFIVGARYGAGFATCRTDGGWSAPAGVQLEGGSLGAQLGVKQTDVVMLLMEDTARNNLLQNRYTLAANASIQAGPTGRAISTDEADILVWTRSDGAFAELSVSGITIEEDDGANRELYGRDISNREILTGQVKPPALTQNFLDTVKSTKR